MGKSAGVFPEFPVAAPRPQGRSGAPPQVGGAKPAAYVPPAMRNRTIPGGATSRYREDYELDSKAKEKQAAAENPENMSKAALKNKKKREAKARQKQEEAAAAPSPRQAAPAQQQQGGASGGMGDNDKKARNLRKKLQAIEKLKEQQAAGQPLEKNQLDKIKTEESLLAELRSLGIS